MRRLPHFYLVCLLAACLAVPGSGARAQDQDRDVRFVVETSRYLLDEQGLRAPGYAISHVPGAPQLPVWTTVVEVPKGADWAVVEVGAAEHVLQAPAPLPSEPVAELQLDGPVNSYSQEAITDALSINSRPDPAIYDIDTLYPAQVVRAGPEGISRGKRLLPIVVYPFQYNPVTRAIRHRPRIEFSVHFAPGHTTPASETAPAPAPVAGSTSQPGILVRTTERGLYRLTYDALKAAGAPVTSLHPAELTMWYLGQPMDIDVTGSEDGKFEPADAVIFYAEPYVGRYMKENVYRLTWSGGPGNRVATRSATPSLARPPVTTIRQRARVEYDRVYYSTYRDLARDADHFYDDPLYASAGMATASTTYALALENAAQSGTAEVRVSVHGGQNLDDRDPDQSLVLRLNGASLGRYQWDGSRTHLITQTVPVASLSSDPNNLGLEAGLNQLPGIPLYWVSPDWAEIVYPARAYAASDRRFIEAVIAMNTPSGEQRLLYLPLMLKSGSTAQSAAAQPASAGDVAVAGFTTRGIRVYDVSDARHPVLLTGVRETGAGGRYTATFAWTADTSYYLATEAGFLPAPSLHHDAASTLHSPANTADYIAIVHRSLWSSVQPLLDHRAAEGLRVAKVDIQDVYNEFSGSRLDPEAVRAFLSYAYHNWNENGPRPRYVLLVGDGHYDFKGALRPDLPNLIPPYLLDVDPYIGETAADNRYASVDGDADFMPDMAIGRIPARSPGDVTAVVSKILAYEDGAVAGAWQNRAVFVADTRDDPDYNFHALSDETRTALPPSYESRTIYYDASSPSLDTPAEMKAAIKSAFDDGALYLQWFGHAARTRWGKDRIWEVDDLPKLAQNSIWPFTASFSCWAGYFVNIQASAQYGGSELSLAEAMLLAPGRGALADFSPSGLHVGSSLVTLDKVLANAIFEQRIDRAGLAVNAAKMAYFGQSRGSLDLIDTQVLFGDPATRLRLP